MFIFFSIDLSVYVFYHFQHLVNWNGHCLCVCVNKNNVMPGRTWICVLLCYECSISFDDEIFMVKVDNREQFNKQSEWQAKNHFFSQWGMQFNQITSTVIIWWLYYIFVLATFDLWFSNCLIYLPMCLFVWSVDMSFISVISESHNLHFQRWNLQFPLLNWMQRTWQMGMCAIL